MLNAGQGRGVEAGRCLEPVKFKFQGYNARNQCLTQVRVFIVGAFTKYKFVRIN